VSIVRVGLGENNQFGAGYDAIFGKKETTSAKKPTARKKTASRKVAKKKTKKK
jgi:hypothetical protein